MIALSLVPGQLESKSAALKEACEAKMKAEVQAEKALADARVAEVRQVFILRSPPCSPFQTLVCRFVSRCTRLTLSKREIATVNASFGLKSNSKRPLRNTLSSANKWSVFMLRNCFVST